MILGWMAYGQSKSENSISSSSKNYLIRWRGLTYAACLCILYPGVIATGHTQQTSRSSHLSLMFSYHSLLLFVADKNPSQGAATTITAVCFDPSFDTEQQRSEVLPYPIRLLSDHRSIDPNEQCQDVSKALRNQLWELSSEKEIKVDLQQRSNLMFMM